MSVGDIDPSFCSGCSDQICEQILQELGFRVLVKPIEKIRQ